MLTCLSFQVNTSGEDSKSGVEPSEVSNVARHIVNKCPNLRLVGVMTIGALAHSKAVARGDGQPNPDFVSLVEARKEVANILDVSAETLELSMGMSGDFEEAITAGSTSVRVGSSIFGARDYGGASNKEDGSVNKLTEGMAKV
jgi:pyridoxal phosphate enzyme (YggS family)